MNAELANQLHRERWADLVKQYGSTHAVPNHERNLASEILRANYAISDSSMSLAEALKYYAIQPEVAKTFDVDLTIVPAKKRVHKYKAMEDWIAANIGAQVTPKDLAEAGEVSYTTALNYIKDKVGTFFKVKHGLYEIRDREAERAKELAS